MSTSSLLIKLNRIDRLYQPNEKVEGVVIVNCSKGWSHSGIQMVAEGLVWTTFSPKGCYFIYLAFIYYFYHKLVIFYYY